MDIALFCLRIFQKAPDIHVNENGSKTGKSREMAAKSPGESFAFARRSGHLGRGMPDYRAMAATTLRGSVVRRSPNAGQGPPRP
jgi:hypothetical protein